MPDLIVYNDIEEKNEIESRMFTPMSNHDQLIQYLDMMDLMRVFGSDKPRAADEDSTIEWIVLKIEPKS